MEMLNANDGKLQKVSLQEFKSSRNIKAGNHLYISARYPLEVRFLWYLIMLPAS